MKKTTALLCVFCMVLLFAACGEPKEEAFDFAAVKTEVEDKLSAFDMPGALALVRQARENEALDEKDAPAAKALEQKVRALCYSGSLVAQAETVISVLPTAIGQNSYFTVESLLDGEVFCRYTFENAEQRNKAAEEYKAYLDKYFTFQETLSKSDYDVHLYTDENGAKLKLQCFNANYDSYDFCVLLSNALFDQSAINTAKKNAMLNDPSILIIE